VCLGRLDLGDEEWAVTGRLLPKRERGPRRKDDRRILNGIFYILRTGAPWRDLPHRYGPRTTVYNRYALGRAGRLEGHIRSSGARMRRRPGVYRCLHHQSSPGHKRLKKGALAEGIGRSHGGRTRKVHAAVDACGRPLRLTITGGHVHDSQAMSAFLDWKNRLSPSSPGLPHSSDPTALLDPAVT